MAILALTFDDGYLNIVLALPILKNTKYLQQYLIPLIP